MMFAAALELKSWVGTQVKYYKGDTVESIVRQFESFQDLDCLVMMGRVNEDNEGQKEVRKIAAFLKKIPLRQADFGRFEELHLQPQRRQFPLH